MKKIISILIFALLPLTAFAEDEIKKVSIIHAGTLLNIAGNEPLNEYSVVIEDDKILDIKQGFIDQEGAVIVDMTDKFVMAGLFDAHIHMAEGDLSKPNANSADHALMGVINSHKVLMAGFTTVRDLGARDDTLYKVIDAIDAGDIIGPRIIPGGIIIGVGSRANGLECNGIESCRKTTRDMIKAGAKWIKIRSSCRGGQLCSNEDGAPIFFDEEIKTIIDVADKYNIPVATHSHTRDSSLQVLKYNIKSLEHGTFMNEAAMDMMIKKDVIYVPTMANLDETEQVATNPETDPVYAEHNMKFVVRHPKTLLKAYKKGVKIATGTDGDGRNAGTNYREIEYFVKSGIPIADTLKMATINSAELLGFEDTLGTIEAGKTADIIALEGNPLEDIKAIRNVVFVMKDGKVYKDN